MSQPAETIKTTENSSPDSFSDFFTETFTTDASQDSQTDASVVPVNQAAAILGITPRSVWRRLKQKTLASRLVNGKTFVLLPRGSHDDASQTRPSDTLVFDSDVSVLDSDVSQDETSSIELKDRIRELELKLEGATFRNGYLEAENTGLRELLGAKETQIKLLTDSHSKSPSWWTRFCSWFIGRSPNV